MFNLSTGELLVVLVIVMLVFGASRLPELGRGLGEGINSFRDALRSDSRSAQEKAEKTPPPKEKD
jgi:sec-independent protein translocase protein TatA